jgi:methyl-accepting chemotaxis protein
MLAKRIPHLIVTDLIMVTFFLGASMMRYLDHRDIYLTFLLAVWATSLVGYPLSLALVRAARYEPAAVIGGLATLVNVCWLSFLLKVAGIGDIYRFATYAIIAMVCNSFVSLRFRQVLAFGLATMAVYIAYLFAVLVPSIGAADPEFRSLAPMVFILLTLANTVIAVGARTNEDLIVESARASERDRNKAERLGELVAGSSGSLRVGEELGAAAVEGMGKAQEARARISALEASAAELSSGARSAEEANEAVAAFARQMRAAVADQNKVIHETSAALSEIAATIASMASIAGAKKSGIDSVISGFERQRREMLQVVDGMAAAREAAEKVAASAALIIDVSEKTDLLAMNASIEAAHAGQSGKGFAVISMEIRKLSEEARQGTRNISDSLSASDEAIKKAMELARSYQVSFESDLEQIRSTLAAMDEILRGLQEMESANLELRGATATLVDIADKTEAGATEVAKKTEESARAVRRISEFSGELLGDARRIMSHFTATEDALRSIEAIGKRNLAAIAHLGSSLELIQENAGPSAPPRVTGPVAESPLT